MNWRKLLVLAALIGGTACHKKVSVVIPQPPAPPVVVVAIPLALRDGDAAFDSGDFAEASRLYESYLQIDPLPEDRDRILFQSGVARTLSGVAALEATSSDFFSQLIRDYPKSAYVPPARMILSLRADVDQLHADKVRSQADTVRMQAEEKNKDDKISSLIADLERSKSDADHLQADKVRLQAEQRTRDDKIKQLNDELDRIKKVDSERRRKP